VTALAVQLARAGFVAADEEAGELAQRAGGDPAALGALTARRLAGEPLAWITGRVDFGSLAVLVHPGVYVPRWQSLELAGRAAGCLPADGKAVDLCTGTGAVAATMRAARPDAHVVATDTDSRAVACARANGIDARQGDLFDAVPASFRGVTDVVVAVVPYVPSPALRLLPRHTLEFEDAAHYDGGADGTAVLARVVRAAPEFLCRGGTLLLELGGDQAELLAPLLADAGYDAVETWSDEDGDRRGLQARRA
jgi:release factor glutamine methyltransferase